ncbi:MAG: hypothetical protein JXA89_28450 [Anaerolineae bacterium]|nr:hypothetical protein [Anaerolineae bacterium]
MEHPNTWLSLDQTATYQIVVQGELDEDWAARFDDGRRVSSIVISVEQGVTTLTGTVADQPALYGWLGKLRDLSLALLSVKRIEAVCVLI